ncbi:MULTISPECIES: BT_3987 domain-containing protein [Chitinophagaceae]
MKIRYFLFALLVASVACKKSGDTLYNGAIEGPTNSTSYEAISSSLTLVNDTWILGSDAIFPMKLTQSFQRDIQVTMSIDPSRAKQYDSANATGILLPTIPVGALDLANNGLLTIKAGQTQSQDSVCLIVKNASLLVKGVTYLVPIVVAHTDINLSADVTNNTIYLKIAVGSSLNSIATIQGGNVVIDTLVRTSLGATPKGQDVFYIHGFNQTAAPFDQKMEIAVNNDSVAKYNATNGTDYLVLPSDYYQLTKGIVTIPKGAVASVDSFIVKLTDLSLFDATKKYLLPIELKTVTGNGINSPIDTTKKMIYVVVTTIVSNVNPSNPAVTGTQTDRTNWVMKESGHYSSYVINNAKDGNYATSWFANYTAATPAWFTIDLGAVKSIKGFMFSPNYVYTSTSYVPTGITIQISTDGTNWTETGKYSGTNTVGSVASPEMKYISFYEAVASRYFRFTITAPASGYAGMSEIFSYE